MSQQGKPGTILVPIDFSEQSIVALDQAVSLSRVFNSEIHVLNVINEEFSLSKLFDDNDRLLFQERAKERLLEFAKQKGEEYGIELHPIQVTGKIYNQIVNTADVIDAEFVVMGTAGNSTIKKKFIGSNALRVVRESRKPVITIKGKHHRKGCKNIVLPLDLTKETKEKVTKAVEFSKRFGSIIRVVSVLMINDEFIVNRLTRQLDQVKKYISDQGVECTAEIIRDTKGEHTLAESIIDYTTRTKGDLIMIMTQQEQDFTDFFIGSSAQEVINNSEIPVLSIVPTPKRDTSTFTPY